MAKAGGEVGSREERGDGCAMGQAYACSALCPPAPSLNRRGAKDSSTCKLLSLVILELLRFGFRTANGAQERLRAKGLRHGVSETIG